jgi:predicted metal-dependent enzyme (double-stranded beta helix superfamily)
MSEVDGRFGDFVAAVEELQGGGLSSAELVNGVANALNPLLHERDWLDPRFLRPLPGKPYTQYLLHLGSQGSWSVVSFVWPAGASTPVHDHGCWGVVGVFQGEETETTFRLHGNRDEGPVSLSRGASSTLGPGGITTVAPPDDVHEVSNRGGTDAVSIHVYGSDIGRQPRHTFDVETGRVRRFVSGYDEPLRS